MDLWVAKQWMRDVQGWKGQQLGPRRGTSNTSGHAVRYTDSFINNPDCFTCMTQYMHEEWDLIIIKDAFTAATKVAVVWSHNRSIEVCGSHGSRAGIIKPRVTTQARAFCLAIKSENNQSCSL
jgi:hypothetical protein